ncbi:MAG: type IV toxin-antitoxin system AbiEi family antitoxin domain-containing protein, partial [Bacteroidales bacterium]|nr:type IV toxin-antitoxin system AbiEi family antitoxin domain-containing protein [Bacteroidales bacterium]
MQVNKFGKKAIICQICLPLHLKLQKVFMTITDYIKQFALVQNKPFQRAELMQYLESHNISRTSAKVALYRLARSGHLNNVGHGLYCLSAKHNMEFQYSPSDDELNLAQQVRDKFPFADFCIWKPAVLIPYMQHVPALRIIFVDVEKVASESVLYFLQGLQEHKT